MTWVTWRQHRVEALWALVLAGLVGGFTAYAAYELWLAAPNCPITVGHGFCLSNDVFGQIAQAIMRFNLFQYGLVVLPALAGAFIGAPLVAREIENGTQHLAWTQGVTRMRWLLTKLVVVFVPLLAAAALIGYLEVVLLNVQGSQVNRWDVFDQQTPVVPAATFLALALGFADYYDSTGHLLGNLLGPNTGQPSYVIQYFQPGDRFWAFQTIESAILARLAL